MTRDDKKEEIVTKETLTFSLQTPMLTSTNYTIWAVRVKAILNANNLWEVVEPQEGMLKVDVKKDRTTIAYLFQAIPEDMVMQVASHTTAREIWEALKTRHVGIDRVQKARLQSLRTEFEMLSMRETETIDQFAGRLSAISTKSKTL